MINLIPPSAKKSITREYWLRVISVWFVGMTVALLAGIVIMVPAYVLIGLQVSASENSSREASQKIAGYESVSKDLDYANQQARAIIDNFRFLPMSDYVHMVRAHENAEVVVSEVRVNRAKEGFGPVSVVGEASNRQALATFRDRLLAEPEVESVDLPISNLAKDKDIQFTLSVVVKKSS